MMLTVKTIIRPILGFTSGTVLGLASMLYMNDIVYSIFKQKLISPIYKQYNKNQDFNTDSVRNISYTTARGSLDVLNEVRPHAIDRSNVKKIFIDDKDFSQPQDHYYSFIRRRKQANLEQIQNQTTNEDHQWSQKHDRKDYKSLEKKQIHQVFGKSLNYDGRKNLDSIGQRYIEQQRKQEDLDLIAQKSKKLKSSSMQNQSNLLTQYINPQNEDNLAMNSSSLLKLQKTHKSSRPTRKVQQSPQKIQKIIAQKAKEQKNMSIQGKKIQQMGNLPHFTESMLDNFMRNPNQIRNQNEFIRKQRDATSINDSKKKLKDKTSTIRNLDQLKPRSGDMTTDLRQINFEDKKRLLKLASKARDLD